MSIYKSVEWSVDADWESHDCESCGMSYEEVNISSAGRGKFYVRANWGCYSGNTISDVNADETITWIRHQLPEGMFSEGTLTELERQLNEVV